MEYPAHDEAKMDVLYKMVENLTGRVNELTKCIFGNGRPGMKYEFIEVKNAMKYNNVVTSIMALAFIGNLIKMLFFP